LPRVYNFFRFRIGDDALAEDLTATTFIKAWRARASYRPEQAALSTWLFAIARNVAADHYHSQRPHLSLEDVSGLAGEDSLESTVMMQLDYDRLTILLNALLPRERELVALKYGAEMSYTEIAHLTGLTASSVGIILHRTVQHLRRQWDSTS
jgi:RNA polymerase sigma-70 factor (ECF subfamily)